MSKPSWQNNRLTTLIIWSLAALIRVWGVFSPAQTNDMNTFQAWSSSFWIHGPQSFFTNVWSDYLPLPILTFAPISTLADFFHAPFSLTFKLVHVVIEIVIISLLPRLPLLPKLLLLFSPVLIGDTAIWGQVDTIPALLALLSLTKLLTPGVKGEHLPAQAGTPGVLTASIAFGLAVAYKPIIALIAPILWIVSLKKGQSWWQFPLVSASIFFLTAIPTGGVHFISHLLTRVISQTGTYPYTTINAFNVWSLVPTGLWVPDNTSVLGISARSFGLFLFIVTMAITLNNWRKVKFASIFAPRISATMLILFYTFTTRMHERHLLFGLPFLALATSIESWLIIPFILLSLFFTLNVYGAFIWLEGGQVWPYSQAIIAFISWGITLTALALATIWSWSKFYLSLKNIFKKNFILIVILILASCLRLINLGHPQNYIFDEVYHAFTAREYLHNHVEAWEWWTTPPEGVAYEWTHPAVAKYGMVVGMLLFGENSFGWRVGSAVAGIMSILGLYLLVYASTGNKRLAQIAAFLLSIEGLHIAQSRIAMNDMYMLNFYIWSLYTAIRSRWKGAAILYGLSLASKWSALYGVIPLAFIYLYQNPLKKWSLKVTLSHLLFAIRCLLIASIVYFLTFIPFFTAGHTWTQFIELHRQMWYYHTHLVATHGYQSTPREWIFDVRPVWYHVKYIGNTISNIYAIGNPLILWLGLVGIALQFKKLLTYRYSLFFVAYAIFTLPWIFSPRIMFFYHYLPSAVFLCVILASWLNNLSKKSIFYILVLCSISFVLISPMLYAIPLPKEYWDTLFKLIPSWK